MPQLTYTLNTKKSGGGFKHELPAEHVKLMGLLTEWFSKQLDHPTTVGDDDTVIVSGSAIADFANLAGSMLPKHTVMDMLRTILGGYLGDHKADILLVCPNFEAISKLIPPEEVSIKNGKPFFSDPTLKPLRTALGIGDDAAVTGFPGFYPPEDGSVYVAGTTVVTVKDINFPKVDWKKGGSLVVYMMMQYWAPSDISSFRGFINKAFAEPGAGGGVATKKAIIINFPRVSMYLVNLTDSAITGTLKAWAKSRYIHYNGELPSYGWPNIIPGNATGIFNARGLKNASDLAGSLRLGARFASLGKNCDVFRPGIANKGKARIAIPDSSTAEVFSRTAARNPAAVNDAVLKFRAAIAGAADDKKSEVRATALTTCYAEVWTAFNNMTEV